MQTTKAGGYGQEAYGDPFGSGGPLHVVRAKAIASQVVRVVFDEEPRHRSAAGETDALNPANYTISVVTGQVFDPVLGPNGIVQVVGVDKQMVTGPAMGPVLAGDERAFDIHTDKALSIAVTYRVTAANIRSKVGGILGAPFSADFPGMQPLPAIKPPRQPRGFADVANDISTGGWIIDDSGDLSLEDGLASLKKRIFRRLTTTRGAFTFLPDYGVGLKLKELGSAGDLAEVKADITEQVSQEPEVQRTEVSLSLLPQGILFVTMKVSTKTGAVVELQAQRGPEGSVLL